MTGCTQFHWIGHISNSSAPRLHRNVNMSLTTIRQFLKMNLVSSKTPPFNSKYCQIFNQSSAGPVRCHMHSVQNSKQNLIASEKSNIISQVTFSKWVAPIVPVLKRDGKIRICGDYKLTVNQATKTDPYPLPRIEDIFASLSKGKSFTKLDLAHAYQQVPLSDEAKELTTINTHKGLNQYNRLPFGVSSAPAIFQRTMDSLLQGLPNVCVYLDDLLITGQSDEEHLKTLDTVLARLHEAGVRLKLEKCAFMLSVVEYLGHRISAGGLHPTLEKVKAVRNAPTPTNVPQLKSFLGILAYNCKFLPNMSTVLAPL